MRDTPDGILCVRTDRKLSKKEAACQGCAVRAASDADISD